MSTNMEMAEDAGENIVIVGGGICGLATALALHRFCFHLFLYFIFSFHSRLLLLCIEDTACLVHIDYID